MTDCLKRADHGVAWRIPNSCLASHQSSSSGALESLVDSQLKHMSLKMPSENYEVLESHKDQKDSPNWGSPSRNLSVEDFLSQVSGKPAISCLFFISYPLFPGRAGMLMCEG